VKNLQVFCERLHNALHECGIELYVKPITTRIEDEEDENHYADIFSFDANLYCPAFIATLKITYSRVVDGYKSDFQNDFFKVQFSSDLKRSFEETRECWSIMVHRTPDDQIKFLNDFANDIVSHIMRAPRIY